MTTVQEMVFQRLYAQRISQPTFESPAQMVARLGAMQAQDYASAKWALGLRLVNGAADTIEQAIADQSIVRTWPMRGTLHLVAAEDIHWLLKLMAPATITGNARRYRELELDEPTFSRSSHLIVEALQEQQLTRTALLGILEQQGISTEGQRAAYILQRAALERLICRGAADGSSATYCLLTVPEGQPRTQEEALAELARRYFSSHGPATLYDFVWWSGLRVAEARAGLEAAKVDLRHETMEGQTYWWAEPIPTAHTSASPAVYLLPGFDEYYLGYRDRGAIVDAQHTDKIVPGGNGIFKPIIVVDGRVVGIWKRTIKKDKVLIEAMPFETLNPTEIDGFAAAAARYGEFLGLPVVVA